MSTPQIGGRRNLTTQPSPRCVRALALPLCGISPASPPRASLAVREGAGAAATRAGRVLDMWHARAETTPGAARIHHNPALAAGRKCGHAPGDAARARVAQAEGARGRPSPPGRQPGGDRLWDTELGGDGGVSSLSWAVDGVLGLEVIRERPPKSGAGGSSGKVAYPNTTAYFGFGDVGGPVDMPMAPERINLPEGCGQAPRLLRVHRANGDSGARGL